MGNPKDLYGKEFKVGTRVRLLHHVYGEWFDCLPEDEKSDLESMLGEIFEITEINKSGYASIEKWWGGEKENCVHSMGHSISVEGKQIEVVE